MVTAILCGFKGCGKTYFGQRLAEQLQRPFIDTDRVVEALYRKRHGREWTCREIFAQRGAAAFARLEEEVMDRAFETPSIVALGGGTVLNQRILPLLLRAGKLIYLRAKKEVVRQRMLTMPPSFLDPEDVEGSFERLYAERLLLYEALDATVIDVVGSDEEVLAHLTRVIYEPIPVFKKAAF